jgi:hypothetical protein
MNYEYGYRIPHGWDFAILFKLTGLPADALLFPEQYLRGHSDFHSEFAERAPRAGADLVSPPKSSLSSTQGGGMRENAVPDGMALWNLRIGLSQGSSEKSALAVVMT